MLVGSFGWSSIFLINIPIGIIGFEASLFILPKEQAVGETERFDYWGSMGVHMQQFPKAMISALHTVFWTAAIVCVIGAVVSGLNRESGQ